MENTIDFSKTKNFNSLVSNYINKKEGLEIFYSKYPTYSNINKQAKEKLLKYTNRELLVEVIRKQHEKLDLSTNQKKNIVLLEKSNTATITTGHQLNLMSGPLFTIYKVLQTIKICDDLNTKQKELNYVPIFWMATEDHDWNEINNFTFNKNNLEWKTIEKKGAVGDFSITELKGFLKEFLNEISTNGFKNELITLIENSYLNKNISNLSEATRLFFHELFKSFGLLIINPNDLDLKKTFIPYIKNELFNQVVFKEVSKTNLKLNKHEIQVNPRDINLFYLDKNVRERILIQDGLFKINNTEIVYNRAAIEKIVEDSPEKFSPNVLLRPLYQEVALPNAAYIGGGSEISYWLQLKQLFDNQNVLFPILIPRKSIVLIKEKQIKKLTSLKISLEELFLPTTILINKKIKEKSLLKIQFDELKKEISILYKNLNKEAIKTDKTFLHLVSAQKIRQLKAIDALEKRLLKAEKNKYQLHVNKIEELKLDLFPNNSFQERVVNFSEFYLTHGENLFNKIYSSIQPLDFNFSVIVL